MMEVLITAGARSSPAAFDARGLINKTTSSPPSTMSTGTEDLVDNSHDAMTR
jgi:hypothetical protein